MSEDARPEGDTGEPPATPFVRRALQRYLDGRSAGLRVTECERISGGFETFIYGFRVAAVDGTRSADGGSGLPLDRRLILRVYRGLGVVERSAWEQAVIERVRRDGIPAPAVYLYEPDPAPLGGPFLVLELVAGERMDEAALAASPIAVLRLIRNFARAQRSIYALAWPEGRALVPGVDDGDLGPFAWVPDRLAAARRDLQERGLLQLLPVVEWLEQHRAAVDRGEQVLIHGDFHPLNVFAQGTRISGIIDWGAGGFANKHEDIGWTSVLIATASAVDKKEDRRLAPFRTVAHRVYLAALWKDGGLDRAQLRYGEVYAALRWMQLFLPSYLPNTGPPPLNADAAQYTTARYVKRVRRFIEKRTKLTLAIE